jgi:opacity protein-like surface antigen
VQETIDQVAYNGVTSLYGGEVRYDINEKWDIGGQVSALHSLMNNQFDYSAGLSIGHSIMENVWLNLGYNVIGFDDRDFSRGRSTSKGFFLKFRIKIDQQTVKEAKTRFVSK